MSQDQLAGLSDLYASYVNEIERGKRNPSLRVVLRLLAALDCTLDDVMVAGGKSAVPVRNRAPRT